ncbi:phage tail protein [Lactococcus petauri]|uniref:phage tail protein n=1 Tax=Lactococcus petauri TaxID=1940789 RepID=UPI00385357FC
MDGTINSRIDLGLRISEVPIIPVAERVIDSIEIDGREGDLTILKGWKDVNFSFKAVIWNSDVQTSWQTILPQILNAKTITFSNDISVFYKIKYAKASGLTQILSSMWEFEVELTCSPFRYKTNVVTINRTTSGTVNNPGNIYSLPKIKVYGTGTRTLTINGKQIMLNLTNGNLTLDCDWKECFYGDVAANQYMTGDFPEFRVGSNTVTLGTGITKVEIEPRWRYL